MSETWDREKALTEIRPIVWRYLRASALLSRPLGVAPSAPEQLPIGDLTRLTAAHLAVHSSTREVLAASGQLLRRMPASVERQRETTYGFVRGRVDWQRTVQTRITTSDPTVFVCERTDRRYDTSLGRLLKCTLAGISRLRHLVGELGPASSEDSLKGLVTTQATTADRYLQDAKLRQVRLVEPHRLRHLDALVRRYPDTQPLVDFVKVLRRLKSRDSGLLQELLDEQILSPSRNDAIFELKVGLAILDAMRNRGYTLDEPLTLLEDSGEARVPFAVLNDGNSQVRVWWQRNVWAVRHVPASEGWWWRILDQNDLKHKQPLRPDFVVESTDPAKLILVEVKLTEKNDHTEERDGIRDMLAYLADLDAAANPRVHATGVVAAWNASGKPARSDLRLVVCDQDSVISTMESLLTGAAPPA